MIPSTRSARSGRVAWSLRARLTVWYALVLILVLVLFGANVLIAGQRLGLRRMDEQLAQLHATLMKVLNAELEEGGSLKAAAEEAVDTVGASGTAATVLDESRRVLAATHGAAPIGEFAPPISGDTPSGAPGYSSVVSGSSRTHPVSGENWRERVWPERVSSKDVERDVLVIVARPQSDFEREQHEVREAMLVGFPIALLLAGAGGLWIASVGLRPITRMAEQATLIQPSGLEDLGETERRDELGQLARAFNGLVARLRAALKTQRQFMADASHELRTPISVVRTAADVALTRDHRDEAEYRETLTIVRDESRRLSRLVEDMLTLARADAGGYQLRREALYLDEVVEDCRRAVAVLAADRGITVNAAAAESEVACEGDEQLLRQLVLNLLQNAIQHTPRGGVVSIDMRVQADRVDIRVTDTGPGIPPADRERIFDRFVQLDPSREGKGAGLGLPIARWIAETHGGALVLESGGPDGSVFRATLPR